MPIQSKNRNKHITEDNPIQTVPDVPPSRYTGTDHDDRGILELKAYNSCVSFGVEPMYTLPTSTTNHCNNYNRLIEKINHVIHFDQLGCFVDQCDQLWCLLNHQSIDLLTTS